MPYAAPSRCSEPGCTDIALKLGRCGLHQRAPWAGRSSSQARYGLSGSAQQSLHRSILKRDGFVCYICGLPGADTVDHVIAIWKGGAKVDPANLAAIHQDPCHEVKTKRENAERSAMRAARRAAARDAAL